MLDAPARPHGRSSRGFWKGLGVGIGIGVVLSIVALVAFHSLGSEAPTVDVTAVNFQFVGGPCVGWENISTTGLTTDTGTQFAETLHLSNPPSSGTCTAATVSTPTPGFSIYSSNAPLTVNGGTTQSLSVLVHAPSSEFSGVLTLVIAVTIPP